MFDTSMNFAKIRVVGVGGAGNNAVNRMVESDIISADFYAVNTDKQPLLLSKADNKIQIGAEATKGLGAGSNPELGEIAAEESRRELEEMCEGVNLLFIAAGMGGGTGTGAAPVIAAMAKKKGILTVGVVTIPFKSEGNESMSKAIDGINELEKNVDSLIIINNEKIYKEYGDLLIQDAFPKADEVLATAVRGITEIIKRRGFINVDFKDVKAMMTNSGMALMGCGTGSGANRIKDAVKMAMDSPLLNDFDIKTAKNVLINITVGDNKEGLHMKQLDEIDKLIKDYTGKANNFKRGIVFEEDPEFGDKVSITVIATGFKMARLSEITEGNVGNIINIDSDFVYRKDECISEDGIELPEVRSMKIGYNNTAIRKGITFDEDCKPALLVGEGEDKSELENTPAIKRRAGKKSKE